MNWEYRFEQWEPGSRAGDRSLTGILGFEELFRELGTYGWEYVGSVQIPVTSARAAERLIFKRPVARSVPVWPFGASVDDGHQIAG